MKQTYLEAWKRYLQEAVEWRDGDLSIKVEEDPDDKDYHNIWISNTTTKTTYVWKVYVDPDKALVPDIRIDVKSIVESTKLMTYRYWHPLKREWKSGKSTINDADWTKVKNNYAKRSTITFTKAPGKDFVVYLEFKKSFKY